jgi:hypothetical protein
MAPFASHQEDFNDNGAVGLYIEIPLTSTKKHIATGSSAAEDLISEDDLTHLTTSTSMSTAFIGNFLEFGACFSPCSNYSTSSIPRTGSDIFEVRTCCGCGRDFNKREGYTREIAVVETKKMTTPNDIDIRDVSEQGEADIDVVIDGEAQIYCYECALINQGKVDHARYIKFVMNELLLHFDVLEEDESEHLQELIAGCVDRERNRKIKVLGKNSLGAMKKAMKSTFSSFPLMAGSVDRERSRKRKESGRKSLGAITRAMKSTFSLLQKSKFNRHTPKRVIAPAELEETEEESVQMQEIQTTIYSSPKSIHYRFDNCTNVDGGGTKKKRKKLSSVIQLAKKEYSKSKRRRKSVDDCSSVDDYTKVRAVAVRWS